jgi:hypothetical protein
MRRKGRGRKNQALRDPVRLPGEEVMTMFGIAALLAGLGGLILAGATALYLLARSGRDSRLGG